MVFDIVEQREVFLTSLPSSQLFNKSLSNQFSAYLCHSINISSDLAFLHSLYFFNPYDIFQFLPYILL